MLKKNKVNWQKILSYFVIITLVSTIVFLVFAINKAPTVADPNEPFIRIKSDYALMLSQCILGVVAMLLPGMLEHKLIKFFYFIKYIIILFNIFRIIK